MGEKTFYIEIHVKPRAKKKGFFRQNNTLVYYTTEAPLKGKVNRELIKEISKKLSVSSSEINIVKGLHSRNKIVSINTEKYRSNQEIISQLLK